MSKAARGGLGRTTLRQMVSVAGLIAVLLLALPAARAQRVFHAFSETGTTTTTATSEAPTNSGIDENPFSREDIYNWDGRGAASPRPIVIPQRMPRELHDSVLQDGTYSLPLITEPLYDPITMLPNNHRTQNHGERIDERMMETCSRRMTTMGSEEESACRRRMSNLMSSASLTTEGENSFEGALPLFNAPSLYPEQEEQTSSLSPTRFNMASAFSRSNAVLPSGSLTDAELFSGPVPRHDPVEASIAEETMPSVRSLQVMQVRDSSPNGGILVDSNGAVYDFTGSVVGTHGAEGTLMFPRGDTGAFVGSPGAPPSFHGRPSSPGQPAFPIPPAGHGGFDRVGGSPVAFNPPLLHDPPHIHQPHPPPSVPSGHMVDDWRHHSHDLAPGEVLGPHHHIPPHHHHMPPHNHHSHPHPGHIPRPPDPLRIVRGVLDTVASILPFSASSRRNENRETRREPNSSNDEPIVRRVHTAPETLDFDMYTGLFNENEMKPPEPNTYHEFPDKPLDPYAHPARAGRDDIDFGPRPTHDPSDPNNFNINFEMFEIPVSARRVGTQSYEPNEGRTMETYNSDMFSEDGPVIRNRLRHTPGNRRRNERNGMRGRLRNEVGNRHRRLIGHHRPNGHRHRHRRHRHHDRRHRHHRHHGRHRHHRHHRHMPMDFESENRLNNIRPHRPNRGVPRRNGRVHNSVRARNRAWVRAPNRSRNGARMRRRDRVMNTYEAMHSYDEVDPEHTDSRFTTFQLRTPGVSNPRAPTSGNIPRTSTTTRPSSRSSTLPTIQPTPRSTARSTPAPRIGSRAPVNSASASSRPNIIRPEARNRVVVQPPRSTTSSNPRLRPQPSTSNTSARPRAPNPAAASGPVGAPGTSLDEGPSRSSPSDRANTERPRTGAAQPGPRTSSPQPPTQPRAASPQPSTQPRASSPQPSNLPRASSPQPSNQPRASSPQPSTQPRASSPQPQPRTNTPSRPSPQPSGRATTSGTPRSQPSPGLANSGGSTESAPSGAATDRSPTRGTNSPPASSATNRARNSTPQPSRASAPGSASGQPSSPVSTGRTVVNAPPTSSASAAAGSAINTASSPPRRNINAAPRLTRPVGGNTPRVVRDRPTPVLPINRNVRVNPPSRGPQPVAAQPTPSPARRASRPVVPGPRVVRVQADDEDNSEYASFDHEPHEFEDVDLYDLFDPIPHGRSMDTMNLDEVEPQSRGNNEHECRSQFGSEGTMYMTGVHLFTLTNPLLRSRVGRNVEVMQALDGEEFQQPPETYDETADSEGCCGQPNCDCSRRRRDEFVRSESDYIPPDYTSPRHPSIRGNAFRVFAAMRVDE